MITKISSSNFKSSLTNIFKEVFPSLDPAYRNMMRADGVVAVKNPLYKSITTKDMQNEYKLQKQAVDKFVKSKMP